MLLLLADEIKQTCQHLRIFFSLQYALKVQWVGFRGGYWENLAEIEYNIQNYVFIHIKSPGSKNCVFIILEWVFFGCYCHWYWIGGQTHAKTDQWCMWSTPSTANQNSIQRHLQEFNVLYINLNISCMCTFWILDLQAKENNILLWCQTSTVISTYAETVMQVYVKDY